jgi:hypothetical protein
MNRMRKIDYFKKKVIKKKDIMLWLINKLVNIEENMRLYKLVQINLKMS